MGRPQIRLLKVPPLDAAPAARSADSSAEVERKAALCASALTEAHRQIAAQRLGPVLRQLLARACELQDEMDEVLLGLDPIVNPEPFARAATLHRNLEEIQSRLPREFRRRSPGGRPVRR
jgi:hypothetical protein